MFPALLLVFLFIGAFALVANVVVILLSIVVGIYYVVGWPLTKWAFSVLWKGITLPFRLLIPRVKI